MSKRIDKKKLKRQSETTAATTVSTAAAPAPVERVCEQVDFFIQYQNQEYLEREILEKIKEKCKAEGTEITGAEKLSVYLKPEDQKAYYTYAGISGSIDL